MRSGHSLYKCKGPERVSLVRENVPGAWGTGPRKEGELQPHMSTASLPPFYLLALVF